MDAAEERLPDALPLSVVVPYDALEGRDRPSLLDGAGARILLRGLLLVPDAAVICGWRHESFVNGYDYGVSANREDLSGRALGSADRGLSISLAPILSRDPVIGVTENLFPHGHNQLIGGG